MTDLIIKNNSLLFTDETSQIVYVPDSGIVGNTESTVPFQVFNSESNLYFVINDCLIQEQELGGFEDATFDNKVYGRKNGVWVQIPPQTNDTYLYGKAEEFDDFILNAKGLGIDPNDKFISVNDLIDYGLLDNDLNNTLPKEESTPPTPEGLVVSGIVGGIRLRWIPAYTLYKNHYLTQIWRGTTSDRNAANKIADVIAHSDFEDINTTFGVTYYYWIKFVSVQGAVGNFNNVFGTAGNMADASESIIDQLSNNIRSSELYQDLLAPIGELNEATAGLIAITAAHAEDLVTEISNRNAAILSESTARVAALQEEEINRAMAIAIEASNRQQAIDDAAATWAQDILDATAPIDAALAQEIIDRTTAISAESAQRNILATKVMGAGNPNNLSEVSSGLLYETRESISNLEGSLTQQIALLAAGSSNQFDYTKIWYFDSGIEGWWSAGAGPTAVNGWIRPPVSSDPYVGITLTTNIDGTKYPQVRARIRKVGNPTWYGYFSYLIPSDQVWGINGKITTITEPEFDSNNIANITFNLSGLWSSNQITHFLYRLSVTADASNYYEVDWIAVGSPSPGASSADVYAERTARTNADSALSQQITNLSGVVDGKASGSALNALTVRVANTETNISTTSSDLTLLKSKLTFAENTLDPSVWVVGTQGSQGAWICNGASTESTIVLAGSGTVPLGPLGQIEKLWQCQESGNANEIGGYNVAPTTANKIDKSIGTVFSAFVRHNGATSGYIYHGCATDGGIQTIAGTNDYNPYWVAHPVGVFTANKWYLLYGVIHPEGTTVSNELSGIYDCETGIKIIDVGDFRCSSVWNDSNQVYRNYWYYSGDTTYKVWFAQPRVVPLNQSLSPLQLINTSLIKATSTALDSLITTVSGTGGIASKVTALETTVNDVNSTAFNNLKTSINNGMATASDVTALKAQLPGGANLIKSDTEFQLTNADNSAIGWTTFSDGTVTLPYKNHAGADWTPLGFSQIGCNSIEQTCGYLDLRIYDNTSQLISVVPGKRYCFSGFIAGHRIQGLIVKLEWFNSAGTNFSNNDANVAISSGGTSLSNWSLGFVIATAPAGAVKVGLVVRGYRAAGQSTPYIWICQPMFCEVTADAAKPPLYSPSLAGPFAAVDKEALARQTADGLMATDITSLKSELGVAGSSTAATGLIAQVNKAKSDIGTLPEGVTSLSAAFTNLKSVVGDANSGAIQQLNTNTSNINTNSSAITALTAQQNSNSVVLNPQFNPWTAYYPDQWGAWGGTGLSKHTATGKMQWNVTSSQNAGVLQSIENYKYIDVELTFMLLSGGLSGAGILVYWYNTSNTLYQHAIKLADLYTNLSEIYNKKITATFRMKRPATFTGTFSTSQFYLMANFEGLGTRSTKNIVYYSCIATNAGTSADAYETLEAAVNHTDNGLVATANKVLNLESVGGVNLIPSDTDFITGTTELEKLNGWTLGYNDSGHVPTLKHHTNNIPQPTNTKTLELRNLNQVTGECSAGINVPVTAGVRYSFSAWVTAYRARGSLVIQWLNSNGGWFTTSYSNSTYSDSSNGELTNWPRLNMFVTAPAGAVSARLNVFNSSGYGTDPYVFFTRPMFIAVGPTTTAIPAYRSNSLSAKLQQIAATTVDAGGAKSQYALKVQADGFGRRVIAGIGLDALAGPNGTESAMLISADKIAIINPNANTQVLPFIVQDGVVYINAAVIRDASIKSAHIESLDVIKLGGSLADKTGFVKLNSGTLVVDDIAGDSDLIFTSRSTEALEIGIGSDTSYGTAGGSAPILWITVPSRTKSQAYGLQFYVQGTVLKATAGIATIAAEFYNSNSNAAAGTSIPTGAYFSVGTAGFWCVSSGSANTSPTPSQWSAFTVGSVATIYLNSSNFMEGIVQSINYVSQDPYPGVYVRGTYISLRDVVKFGTLPANGAGCTLYSKSVAERYYKKLGVSLATTVNTSVASQKVNYNMSYLDTSAKITAGTSVLCVLSHTGEGSCTNQEVDFTLVSAR